jgi:integrase
MFPRKCNAEFIEVPVMDSTEQRRPTLSSKGAELMLNNVTPGNIKKLSDPKAAEETVEEDKSNATLRMLITLAAASGMRLGEILGLSTGNVSEDGTVLTIIEKVYGGEVQDLLKTKNGKRFVDLDLRESIGNRTGLVFCNRTSKPISRSNLLKRHLHPLLRELKMDICGSTRVPPVPYDSFAQATSTGRAGSILARSCRKEHHRRLRPRS